MAQQSNLVTDCATSYPKYFPRVLTEKKKSDEKKEKNDETKKESISLFKDFGEKFSQSCYYNVQTLLADACLKNNSKGKNFLFSPYNLVTVLTLLYRSLDGDCFLELCKYIFKTHDVQTLNDTVEQIDLMFRGFNTLKEMRVMNFALTNWIDFQKQYLENTKEVLFVRQYTPDEIKLANEFISHFTDGKIINAIDVDSQRDDRSFTKLISVLYFAGSWLYKADKNATRLGDFFTSNGKTKTFFMNFDVGDVFYTENTLKNIPYQFLEMPFENGFRMGFVLPQDVNQVAKQKFWDKINYCKYELVYQKNDLKFAEKVDMILRFERRMYRNYEIVYPENQPEVKILIDQIKSKCQKNNNDISNAYEVLTGLKENELKNDYQGAVINLTFQFIMETIKHLYNKHKIKQIKIPKFQQSFTLSLVDLLKSLGVNVIFTSQKYAGNYDRIFESSHYNMQPISDVCIADFKQKGMIEVNENGATASAFSFMNMDGFRGIDDPVDFVANHPFLYYIRHELTNTILFVGEYHYPEN